LWDSVEYRAPGTQLIDLAVVEGANLFLFFALVVVYDCTLTEMLFVVKWIEQKLHQVVAFLAL
jgi:hypothetical protein